MRSRLPIAGLVLALVLAPALLSACAEPGLDDAGLGADAGTARPDTGPDTGSDAGPDAGPPEDLEGFLRYQMEVGGLPGLAVAVIRDGEVAWQGTYGYADVESERPVTEDTLFFVASLSKTFVAIALMQLVEEGLLDLDAPVDELAGFPVRHPDHPDRPITLRMLLTHSSGIVDDLWTLGRASTLGDSPESLESFARGYLVEGDHYYGESNFGPEPGTSRTYCNACFGILGYLFERAAGETLPAHSERRIFAPLMLDGAAWHLADLDPSRLAVPYTHSLIRGFLPQEQQGYAFYPATSLRISLRGLGRYLRAFMAGGALDGERILSEESVAEMARPQIPEIHERQGLAWSRARIGGRLYLGHSGAGLGMSAQMRFSEEDGRGALLMTNSDAYVRADLGRTDGEEALTRIMERLLSEDPGF